MSALKRTVLRPAQICLEHHTPPRPAAFKCTLMLTRTEQRLVAPMLRAAGPHDP